MFGRLPRLTDDRRRFFRRSVIGIAFAFLVFGQLASWFSQHYRIGIDQAEEPCLPWRVYLVTFGSGDQYKTGDYLAFVSKNGLMGPKFEGQMIAKQVAAVPGDRIEIRADQLYVNGKAYLGPMVLLPKLGLAPGAKDRIERVPEGKLFVVGTLPRAYDSRYWGFLDESRALGKITPIF